MSDFSELHPAVSFLFFVETLLLTMIQMHPVLLGISCVMALLTLWSLKGTRCLTGIQSALCFALLIVVGNAVLNPVGETVLFTYWGGRTFTKESVVWGGCAALLFTAVLLWCQCFHHVMTQEKIQFLFGRKFQALSLLFSLVLRFAPDFVNQLRALTRARACLGLGIKQCDTNQKKIQRAISQLAAFLSLALEQAVVTAASMRGRGYGLSGRRSYSLFRLDAWNCIILCVVTVLGGITVTAIALGGGGAAYFPTVQLAWNGAFWNATRSELLLFAVALVGRVRRVARCVP